MEPRKEVSVLPKNQMEPRKETPEQPVNQRFFHDPSSSINNYVNPPDNGVCFAPNYASQTGEEFSFMRERVNTRKSVHHDANQNSVASNSELSGMSDILCAVSESGSDISAGEKGKQKEKQTSVSSNIEHKLYHGSTKSGADGDISSGSSHNLIGKMKFLCSFGGKILPRPSDGKLRYVGGDTRIIRISKDIGFHELMQKALAMYNKAHTIKYQLPGEDLDALITVSNDEDLQNMMEECHLLKNGEGSQKLRMFLFSLSDLEDVHFGLGNLDENPELQYMVAVNGMDLGIRKNVNGQGLSNILMDFNEQLDLNFQNGAESSRVGMDQLQPEPISSTLLQPQEIFSKDNGVNSHSSDDRIHYFQSKNNPSSIGIIDTTNPSIPPLTSTQYGLYSPGLFVREYSSHPLLNEFPPLNGGLADRLCIGIEGEGAQVPDQDEKYEINNFKQEDVFEKVDTSSMPDDGTPKDYANNVSSLSIPKISFQSGLLPSQDRGTNLDHAQDYTPSDIRNNGQSLEPKDEKYCQSSEIFTLGIPSKYEADLADLKYYEPSLPSHRIFCSERISREQSGSLSRLSKSDDFIGSQYILPQSRLSQVPQGFPIESKVLNEMNQSFQLDKPMLLSEPKFVGPIIEEKIMPVEKDSELTDENTKSKQLYITQEEAGTPKSDCCPGLSNIHEKPLDQDDTTNPAIPIHDNIGKKTQISEFNHVEIPPSDDSDIDCREKINLEDDRGAQEIHTSSNKDEFNRTKVQQKGPSSNEAVPDFLCHSSSKKQENSSSNLPNLYLEEMPFEASKSKPPLPLDKKGIAAGDFSQENSVPIDDKQKQGDILIDINDRFPPDLLYDLFEGRYIENFSPRDIQNDESGLSLNMPTHEPKHWSFFRNLAPSEFSRKDVSLMDQDHVFPMSEVGMEVFKLYPLPTLGGNGTGLDQPELNFGEDIELNAFMPNKNGLDQDNSPSPVSRAHLIDKINEGFYDEETQISKIKEDDTRSVEQEYKEIEPVDGELTKSLNEIYSADLQFIKNEDLEELRELGSGTFGTVYHGKWRGTDVAIKRIKKSCFLGRSSEQERLTLDFWREAKILSRLHHPNVVAFYGVVRDGPGGTLATVTEFMVNGSLRQVLLRKEKEKSLTFHKRLLIAMDAAFGMEYLHSRNIVHFDLKCDNLLVNLKDPLRPICKVGDFGLSKIRRNTLVSGGVRGTLPWMAPELLNGSSSKVSEKVDVFSFGLVMWEILTGEEPYSNMHYGAIIGGIVNNTLRPPVPSSCDPEWRELMEQCWAPDPAVRPSFTEIAGRLRSMSVAHQPKSHGNHTHK